MRKTIKQQILISGVGGQGVLFVTGLLAEAAINKGLPVFTSETHGMAQRGGSVTSHVRCGRKVFSPLIPEGQADVLMGFEDLPYALSWPLGEGRLAHTHWNSQPLGNYDQDLNVGVVSPEQLEALLELQHHELAYADLGDVDARLDADYEDGTPRYYTCQTCHMYARTGKGCDKNNAPTRTDLPQHDHMGGGYWMPDVIQYQDTKGTLRFGGGLTQDQIDAMQDVPGFIRKAKKIYGYDHFINDAGGSLCELDEPDVMETLARETLIIYIRATKEDEARLIERAQSDPKPLYYRPEFLQQALDDYRAEFGNDYVACIDPDRFTRWVFPRLFRDRIPRYEAIAAQHGYSISSAEVMQLGSEADLLELIAEAIARGDA